jgi:hypothetical protein
MQIGRCTIHLLEDSSVRRFGLAVCWMDHLIFTEWRRGVRMRGRNWAGVRDRRLGEMDAIGLLITLTLLPYTFWNGSKNNDTREWIGREELHHRRCWDAGKDFHAWGAG